LDVEPGRLQRGDGRLAAGARALDPNLDLLHPELLRLAGTLLGGPLGGERGALAAALEPDRPGRRRAERVAVGVGDRHDGVVERRLHVGNPTADVPSPLFLLGLRHDLWWGGCGMVGGGGSGWGGA